MRARKPHLAEAVVLAVQERFVLVAAFAEHRKDLD